MMTAEQFLLIQSYLIDALWPFIWFWIAAFIAGAVLVTVLTVSIQVIRAGLTRVA